MRIYLLVFLFISSILNSQEEEFNQLNKKIEIFLKNKQCDSALFYSDKLIEFTKSNYNEEIDLLAKVKEKKGDIYYLCNDFASSSQYYVDLIPLFEQAFADNKAKLSRLYNKIGSSYSNNNQLTLAKNYFIKSIDIKRTLSQDKDTSYATILQNLAVVYQYLGDFSEAENLLNTSLQIKKNLLGKNSLSYANTLMNYASLSQTKGDFNHSKNSFEEAYQIFVKIEGEKSTNSIICSNRLISVYITLKDTNKANALINKFDKDLSKIVLKMKSDDAALFYYNIGKQKYNLNKYEESEEYFHSAMDIVQKKLSKKHFLYSECLSALGIIHWINLKYDEAYNFIEESRKIREEIYGNKHIIYAQTLHTLAGLLKDLNKFDEANKLYYEALDIYLDHFNKVIPFLTNYQRSLFYSHMRERFTLFYNYVITRYDIDKNLLIKMLELNLDTKSILNSNALKIRKLISTSNDKKLKDLYEKLIYIREELGKILTLSKFDQKGLEARFDSLSHLSDNIEKEINSKLKVNINQINSWKNIKNKLKENEAAIEVVRFNNYKNGWTDEVYYAFIIIKSNSKYPELVVLNNGKELESDFFKNYYYSIKSQLDDETSFKHYWESIHQHLNNIKYVYLCPDGVYNKININSLKNEDKFIIDDYNVQYLTSLYDFIDNKAETKISSIALFGNPKFSNNTSQNKTISIEPLPGTIEEINTIENIFKNNSKINVFREENSSEEQIKKLNNPSILHIATHGFFLKDIDDKPLAKYYGVEPEKAAFNPLLRSGLLLAGAEDFFNLMNPDTIANYSENNGILNSYEASLLNLENTDLVVLSACETALGEIKNGEGVYGLQRAFIIAGANNLIMSLWKVDDEATNYLMQEFYSNLNKTKNINTSFFLAQKSMKENYNHPYFWAGFILLK